MAQPGKRLNSARDTPKIVIPANAGISLFFHRSAKRSEMPAFAGMTIMERTLVVAPSARTMPEHTGAQFRPALGEHAKVAPVRRIAISPAAIEEGPRADMHRAIENDHSIRLQSNDGRRPFTFSDSNSLATRADRIFCHQPLRFRSDRPQFRSVMRRVRESAIDTDRD